MASNEDSKGFRKVTIRFRPVGSTRKVNNAVLKVPGNQKFSSLVNYLRRQLGPGTPSLFCYINATFAPSLDAEIEDLWNSYAIDDILNISYCDTVAFG